MPMTREKKKALQLLVKAFPNVSPSKFSFWLTGEEDSAFNMALAVALKLEEDIFLSFLFEPEVPSSERKNFLVKMLEQA